MELYKGKRIWIVDENGDFFEATIRFCGLSLTKPIEPNFTIQVYPEPSQYKYERRYSSKYSKMVDGVIVEELEK